MGLHLLRVADKVLSARVAPSAYLVPLQSLTFGIFFFLFTADPSVTQSVLYRVGPPFGPVVWGLVTTLVTAGFMVSLWMKWKLPVALTAMGLFTIWLGASVAYIKEGYVFQFALIFSQVLTYAYFFVANQLNRLWDYAPERRT